MDRWTTQWVQATGRDGKVIWLNMGRASGMMAVGENQTSVFFSGDQDPFQVIETPEQLLGK
jgi:hypothetical protein